MSYTTVRYDEVEPRAPGMHFLRDALDCENLGVTVLDVDSGWTGKEHDHTHDSQEEVYLLLDGSGKLTVDGADVPLQPGTAVRVDPASTRRLSFDRDSLLVIAGAP
ncbi:MULTISPECIES: cupin domain-containing protein [Salinibaculum]|uniref:cupin domain-containing protein n=1 Tax=Salinibaculum TaxID=2732368 RepID=UPI0030CF875D